MHTKQIPLLCKHGLLAHIMVKHTYQTSDMTLNTSAILIHYLTVLTQFLPIIDTKIDKKTFTVYKVYGRQSRSGLLCSKYQ